MVETLSVRCFTQVSDIDAHAAAWETLNVKSRRKGFFHSWPALKVHIEADASFEGYTPWFLAAFDGDTPKGYLALKFKDGVVTCLRELEVDMPGVVGAPEDEAALARAFYQHLVKHRADWQLLELTQQPVAGSALWPAPSGVDLSHHHARTLEDRENLLLTRPFASAADYLKAFDSSQRSNVRRQSKMTAQSGDLSLLLSDTAQAKSAMFDIYLDIERRSWKARGHGTLGPREAAYRRFFAADFPLDTVFLVLVRDGVPVACFICLGYAGTWYLLATVYDEALEKVGPGVPMNWLAITEGMRRGFTTFNFMPDFAYYKKRWLFDGVATQKVQLFRLGSKLHLKGLLGDLKRAAFATSKAKELGNANRQSAGKAATRVGTTKENAEPLIRAALAAGAQWVKGEALAERLPK
ncbi:MAG: GNAT family N-acetyltransferase [Myxococcaceae bacterium]|nr:GNAT family N-acetyltransferase [Myxococcaceae bacterium]